MNSNSLGTSRSLAVDAVVALMLAGLAAWANILWIEYNRFGLALTIDEAGYMSQAIAYARALKYGGVTGWLAALSYPTKFAPLSPIVSSALMARWGIDENIAFYTHILFYAGIVLIVFWWVREQSTRLAAICAALLVATLPDIVFYTRTYQYGLPTAFFFLLSHFAYYKSRRFSSWFWSFCLGAALGLMLLSRTMSIAFLPAFGLIWLVDSWKLLKQNMARLVMSIVVFALVAVPWYALNFHEIFGYLFSFGYGANSKEYGGTIPYLSLTYVSRRIQFFMDSIYNVHFVLVFVFFAICVVQQARALIRKDKSANPTLWVPAFVSVLCIAILLSSKNIGSGFDAPLYPVMAICAVCTVPNLTTSRAVRGVIYAVMLLGALMVGYLQSTTSACGNAPRLLVRPLMGSTQKKVCDGFIGEYIRGVGENGEDKTNWDDIPYPVQKQWRDVSSQLADRMHDVNKSGGGIIYGTRNRLVNVNTVMLEFIKKFGYILPAAQIDPLLLDPTYKAYREWLDQTATPNTCAVVMMSSVSGDFFPRPDLGLLKQVVADRGFELTARIPTPESDMYAELWTSKHGCSNDGK
ncbi:hypothetical protein G3N95_13255 [Paraburkholderia sp. Tr-20389]|uniref:ArnT family glycosyltransferase n=1 Tax=Paraburkholderia sp. Tr-20389 TaxID=2703903 RepID=UPI0019804D20|nr:glycosyltransferase family 39 protein [Paraburkholderia sp. Tr-20389]MBN3753912.1 hypothetical protein [Paraburkholderia sp. Tr-20389]